jgi:ubiquinone/menaquinone biosynthesis C-methylase UbiE
VAHLKPADFDRLARPYRALEYLAFGRALEAARFKFLDRLRHCRDILVLGEGDGRCLAAMLKAAPDARFRCVDASAGMIAGARERVSASAAGRVVFEQADAVDVDLPSARYDAVVTMFFLDCFTPAVVEQIIGKAMASVRPGGLWLFADFAIPDGTWARLRARLIVRSLYALFRWRTGIAARALPPSEALLQRAGWRPIDQWESRSGLIRSVVFQHAEPTHLHI